MSVEYLPYYDDYKVLKHKILNGQFEEVRRAILHLINTYPEESMTWVFAATIAPTHRERVDLYRRASQYCKGAGELQFITEQLQTALHAVETGQGDAILTPIERVPIPAKEAVADNLEDYFASVPEPPVGSSKTIPKHLLPHVEEVDYKKLQKDIWKKEKTFLPWFDPSGKSRKERRLLMGVFGAGISLLGFQLVMIGIRPPDTEMIMLGAGLCIVSTFLFFK